MRRVSWIAALVTLTVLLGSCGPATPAPTAVPTAAHTAVPTTPPTMTVTVYFGNTALNPGAQDCSKVYPVQRIAPSSADVAGAALQQLFLGPTPAEKENGYVSTFSAATRDILIRVRVRGDTAYVDLNDVRQIIPNASTSCGSAAFLAEMGTTVQEAAKVRRVLYAIAGDPAPFWEWLQIGCAPENDNCDPAPFRDDTQ